MYNLILTNSRINVSIFPNASRFRFLFLSIEYECRVNYLIFVSPTFLCIVFVNPINRDHF